VHDDAAARVAGADEMRVAVPNARGVEAFPGGANEVMLGETPRQARQARIPQALLWPETPRSERGGAGGKAS
jgi:hypothetical protein